MSEDKELQAKIAALAGRINVHKQKEQDPGIGQYPRPHATYGSPPRSSLDHSHRLTTYNEAGGRGRGGSYWAPQRGTPYGSHAPQRGAPYGSHAPRGRGGRVFNRTLVLNNPAGGIALGNGQSSPQPDGNAWIQKRDRHMQLINPAIYDQVAQQRTKDIEQTELQKRQQRDVKEKARLSRHFERDNGEATLNGKTLATREDPMRPYEIDVENIRFRVTDGGSKLVRASTNPNTARATPKQTRIGGVTFFRSKNGNLYRAGLVKSKQNRRIQKINEPCPRFSTTGTCSRGPQCSYLHDPEKIAICKDFLKGSCPLGDSCDLSHEPTANRVPACLHFVRGNCTNDSCRYAHVKVNPSASVCRAFGRLGFCEKGINCTERHVFECPDYANSAVCRNPKCRLPHIDRAGRLRKAAAAQGIPKEEGSPDLSSDEDYDAIDSDDVDSDGLEEDVFMLNTEDQGVDMTQQKDFVKF
ncbi:hypothetical protein K490DRAFT_73063 [Saccharata proteae CBS 121410]|uniref:C3H1-type domain-containing protein n=1 Tax=Saccharata proteae CBS 121410 TaxID=1314787 RepID=A0A9P4HXW1_9PEZI|nr:hypothetical protein K490DRAFT_73063 [Saccharata proteae CBS 121410]